MVVDAHKWRRFLVLIERRCVSFEDRRNSGLRFDGNGKEARCITKSVWKNHGTKTQTFIYKEYGITVADAAITDVDYERVDEKLVKIIDAVNKIINLQTRVDDCPAANPNR